MTRIAEFLDAGGGPVEKPRSNGHYNPPPIPAVSTKQAIAAAKQLGLQAVSVRRFKAYKDLGRYAKELGVLAIGRANILLASEQIQALMAKCDQVYAKLEDPVVQASLLATQDHLLDKYIAGANHLIKSANSDGTDGAHAAVPVGCDGVVA